jgi:DNA-binding NtrC family response regulator
MNIRLPAVETTAQAAVRTDQFISHSPAAQQILRMARRVAASDTSLLLLGETGSGKDWLARAVHSESPRCHAPFIAVNCGAVPESLLESELFGHVKGAFTGAVKDRRGYFELAHRGTLYLDEVGEMPQHLQIKLLRALQDRLIQRLGSEEVIEVDVRFIAATNRDLTAAVKNGTFRQDLYYRLAVVTLQVPALRERLEDIPELVENYLDKHTKKLNRADITGLTPRAAEALLTYDWPGNVRELVNVLERAVLLCEASTIDVVDLPVEIGMPPGSPFHGEAASGAKPLSDPGPWLDQPLDAGRLAVVADFERRYFAHHLERFRGSIAKTAEHAGVDPRTLYSKMRQLGLKKEDFKRG